MYTCITYWDTWIIYSFLFLPKQPFHASWLFNLAPPNVFSWGSRFRPFLYWCCDIFESPYNWVFRLSSPNLNAPLQNPTAPHQDQRSSCIIRDSHDSRLGEARSQDSRLGGTLGGTGRCFFRCKTGAPHGGAPETSHSFGVNRNGWWFRNPVNSPVEVGSWNPIIFQVGPYLEGIIPGLVRFLIIMVIVSPRRIGLWDPFQMA